MNGSTIAIKS